MNNTERLGASMRPAYCEVCGKPAVMWTPGFFVRGYYCADHILVGFDGKIPDDMKLENEPMDEVKP